MTLEPLNDATRQSRLWDEHVGGAELSTDADSEFLAEIQRLETLDRTPPPPPGLSETTWERITGEPLPTALYVPASMPSTNGRYARSSSSFRPFRAVSKRATLIAEIYRFLAVAAMAGISGGFLAGIWARVAMRLSGMLTDDRNRGVLTDAEATVGQMTLGGTLFIAMTGAAIGVLVGLLYMAIRRWLPGRGWQRPLAYGALLLAVFGFVIMDESNPDYQLFGPAWMNVGTFSLAYIVMGFTVGTIADFLEKRLRRPFVTGRSRRRSIIVGIPLAPFAIFGGLGLVFTVVATSGLGALGLIAIACPWLLIAKPNWKFRLPRLIQRPATIAYATLAIPSLFGLTLTVRAIAAIVGG